MIVTKFSLLKFNRKSANFVLLIDIVRLNNYWKPELTLFFFCLDTKETKSQGCFIFLTPKHYKIAKHKKLAFDFRSTI